MMFLCCMLCNVSGRQTLLLNKHDDNPNDVSVGIKLIFLVLPLFTSKISVALSVIFSRISPMPGASTAFALLLLQPQPCRQTFFCFLISVSKHVDQLLTSCAQSLFALRTLLQAQAHKYFKLYSRPLWLTSSPTLPQHGGVSPQRMIECVWRRSFDDAIYSDIIMMTLLRRLTATVHHARASPATADICCTLFSRRNRSNTNFYANDLMATNLRNTHPVSMTVIF